MKSFKQTVKSQATVKYKAVLNRKKNPISIANSLAAIVE
jgi:hypothetical protein